LTQVATFAVRAIPGADGAGLILLEDGRTDTIVATDPFVREVDAIQYGQGEGPRISAAALMQDDAFRVVGVGAALADVRPARRQARRAQCAVAAVAHAGRGLWRDECLRSRKKCIRRSLVELGEMVAVPAAIAVQNAHVLDVARRLAINLQAALSTREVVDQALGVLRSSNGWSAGEAFEHLLSISRAQRAEVADVAQALVDEAVRAAIRRRAGG
jgi:hypothetical protein